MDRSVRILLSIGGIVCGLSVIIGAFGAHYLKPILLANEKLAAFETGVQYQIFHGLAILATGIILQFNSNRSLKVAAWLFLIGILLFSGSLYLLGITNERIFGPITPVGGICFIVGWVYFLLGIKKPVQ